MATRIDPNRRKRIEVMSVESIGDESRDKWNVCRILHGGDGPETTPWFVILGVYDITAEEAVDCYARDHMGGVEDDREYGDGDCMFVAVEQSAGHADVYRCYKRLEVKIDYRLDCERTDLIQVKGMRQNG